MQELVVAALDPDSVRLVVRDGAPVHVSCGWSDDETNAFRDKLKDELASL